MWKLGCANILGLSMHWRRFKLGRSVVYVICIWDCMNGFRTGDPTLGAFLLSTLQGRYRDLLCKALISTVTGSPKFMNLLTEEEAHCKCLTWCIVLWWFCHQDQDTAWKHVFVNWFPTLSVVFEKVVLGCWSSTDVITVSSHILVYLYSPAVCWSDWTLDWAQQLILCDMLTCANMNKLNGYLCRDFHCYSTASALISLLDLIGVHCESCGVLFVRLFDVNNNNVWFCRIEISFA